jgi:hypothetical protein
VHTKRSDVMNGARLLPYFILPSASQSWLLFVGLTSHLHNISTHSLTHSLARSRPTTYHGRLQEVGQE